MEDYDVKITIGTAAIAAWLQRGGHYYRLGYNRLPTLCVLKCNQTKRSDLFYINWK